jgi:hypothetical protein
MSTAVDLATLFRRDLKKLAKQIASFPNDEALWKKLPGVSNTAGNLALHIEGNLREFVGRQLGQLPYARNRELEFSLLEMSQVEIVRRIAELIEIIPPIVERLSARQMETEYPQVVLDAPMSTEKFLIHLYGHLNWHLGQIDTLRRLTDRKP